MAAETRYITVATTRPRRSWAIPASPSIPTTSATRDLVGRHAILPIMKRRIPIVADDAVDKDFGTGAVKMTPAHDPTDFEVGARHGLPRIQVIGFDAKMTEAAGPFAGHGPLRGAQGVSSPSLSGKACWSSRRTTPSRSATAQRCGTVIEPLISHAVVRQDDAAGDRGAWRAQVRAVAHRARALHQDLHRLAGKHPRLEYLAPVLVGPPHPSLVLPGLRRDRRRARRPDDLHALRQRTDWSATPTCWIPGSARGSGRSARSAGRTIPPTCARFYPTSVLETGYDILFFWVARMVMSGIHFLGVVPFHTIYLHGLVRDEQGRKMSKSLGNVIDPIEVMDEYGTDALRFTLATSSTPGNDMKLVAGAHRRQPQLCQQDLERRALRHRPDGGRLAAASRRWRRCSRSRWRTAGSSAGRNDLTVEVDAADG